jgi:Transposase DDE domain
MGTRAKAGTSLEALVRLAMPLLKEAERQCPRTGPGAKPIIPDWFIGALIMVAVLKRKKTKSAQFRFVTDAVHQRLIRDITGQRHFPSRSTFFSRYRRCHQLLRKAIQLQGQEAIKEKIVDASEAAADKSLVPARGRPWHKHEKKQGKIRRGVDIEAAWGYSEYHGWVYGYSFEVVVTCKRKNKTFPLLASVGTGSAAEVRTFAQKIDDLPCEVKRVAADSGYDANELGERIEFDSTGRRTGRRFLCPENPRNNKRKKTKPGHADAARAHSRELRSARKKYLKSATGQRLYRQRSRTVEPFNSWLKSLFELDAGVWHRGLANNQTQILAAIFVYQLLVRYNHRCGNNNGQIRWLTDAL